MNQTHQIKQVVFEIDTDSNSEFVNQDTALQSFFSETVLDELEKLINKTIDTRQVIFIDKLTIDLGTISLSNWQSDFINTLQDEVLKVLPDYSLNENNEINHLGETNFYAVVLHFLKQGVYPWWYEPSDWSSFEDSCKKQLTAVQLLELIKEAQKNKLLRTRLILSFTDELKKHLSLTIKLPGQINLIKRELEQYFKQQSINFTSRKHYSNWFWNTIIQSILISNNSIQWSSIKWIELTLIQKDNPFSHQIQKSDSGLIERAFIEAMAFFVFNKWPEIYEEPTIKERFEKVGVKLPLKKIVDKQPEEKASDQKKKRLINRKELDTDQSIPKNQSGKPKEEEIQIISDKNNQEGQPNQNQVESTGKPREINTSESSVTENKSDNKISQTNLQKTSELPDNKTEKTFAISEFEFVHFAGIIILHPFLPNYFKACELLKDNHWISDQHKIRAVQLLAYLATGTQSCAENQMVLLKFLCDVGLNEPVSPDLEISPEIVTESEELLNAVRTNWSALKGSSIDTIREGFIQRVGKLQVDELGVKLMVEQKTIDILISRLPWSIGVVKLPWLDQLLRVEWT